jgi:hypothetical protein
VREDKETSGLLHGNGDVHLCVFVRVFVRVYMSCLCVRVCVFVQGVRDGEECVYFFV